MTFRQPSTLDVVRTLRGYASDLTAQSRLLPDLGVALHLARLAETMTEEAQAMGGQDDQTAGYREERTAREMGEAETAAGYIPAIIDLRGITDRRKIKWYNPHTTLGDRRGSTRRTRKRGVCVHHTAVAGGFGVRRSGVAYYREREIDLSLWRNAPASLTHEEWVRAMALALRYRGALEVESGGGESYHAITGPNGVLYLNLPLEWVSWHGDGANTDFAGYGWDGDSRVDAIPAYLFDHLGELIETGRSEGHEMSEITCHCVYTNKPSDPGGRVIEEVILPVAKATGCKVDLDFKAHPRALSLREAIERS